MTLENALPIQTRATILVVDDTADNLSLMSEVLKETYQVKLAISGEKALKYLQAGNLPNLILLDILMPGLSGYDVLRELKANPATRFIPVIFLTAMSSPSDENNGLALGAADYICKPISTPILLARVKTQLENKKMADFLRDQNEFLESEVAKRTLELSAIQDVTILAMASLAESRDSDTGYHIRRTQFYVKALAEKLQTHPRFSHFLTRHTVDMLFKSAPLHDIGKVAIPDYILLKPGKLTPAEFEIMKTHTTLGREAIVNAEKQLGMQVEFLRIAKEIACYHQEKWDGSGYPEGLSGDDIPISARLMAVADVYDALISRRVYKQELAHEEAVRLITLGSGQHFDADIVAAFVELQEDFRLIAERFADSEADGSHKSLRVERLQGSEAQTTRNIACLK